MDIEGAPLASMTEGNNDTADFFGGTADCGLRMLRLLNRLRAVDRLQPILSMIGLLEEELTRSIIGAFFNVYNALGFGFLEHIYVMALERELRARGHRVSREASVRINYKGELLANQRIDMIVDERVIVEAKAGPELPPYAKRQLYNYLKATSFEVGILLYFGPIPRIYREIRTNSKKDPPDRCSLPS